MTLLHTVRHCTFPYAGDWPYRFRTEPAEALVEFHSAEPRLDLAGWTEAMEVPYRSEDGLLDARYRMGPGEEVLRLPGPGDYRMRVLLRRAMPSSVMRVQVWAVASSEPPRVLLRPRPAARPGSIGWELLPEELHRMWRRASLVARHRPVDVERFAAGLRRDPAADPWAPGLPSTGFTDLDALLRKEGHRVDRELRAQRPAVARVAAEAGHPVPADLAGCLGLLVALGLLTGDVATGFRYVAEPPPVEDVLDLTPEELAAVRRDRWEHSYERIAEEVAMVRAMWRGHEHDPSELAGLLLVTPEQVRAACSPPEPWPQERSRCDRCRAEECADRIEDEEEDEERWPADDPAKEDDEAYLEAVERWTEERAAELEGEPEDPLLTVYEDRYEDDDDEDGYHEEGPRFADSHWSRRRWRAVAEGPAGAPPRAGVVRADGRVIVWRDGVESVLARLGEAGRSAYADDPWDHDPGRAFETPHGIVVVRAHVGAFGAGNGASAVLVRADGRVEHLGDGHHTSVELSADGHLLAVATGDFGAFTGREGTGLALIDLRTGDRHRLPWPSGDHNLRLVGVHGGHLHFLGSRHRGRHPRTYRWRPGSIPERVPGRLRWIDPATGTGVSTAAGRCRLHLPDGSHRDLPVTDRALLAPGGRYLSWIREDRPGVSVFTASRGEHVGTAWLPERRPSWFRWTVPVWEDAAHLLLPRTTSDVAVPALRLDVTTGCFERMPVEGVGEDVPVFVQPFGVK